MPRLVNLAGAAAVAMTTTFGAAWWYAVATPPASYLPLASPLVDARSKEGWSLLESTPFRTDYDVLSESFVTQSRRGYCGVASATMVLNGLRPSATPLSQEAFFTKRAAAVRSARRVTVAGMTLAQLADLLRSHDSTVSVVYSSDADLESFRNTARNNLVDPTDFILVNYDRGTLHQQGGGHISPVVAYHAATDRFLVLDVAAHRYPPTWIPAAELWGAMNTIDTSSGTSRGFVVVRNGYDGDVLAN